jgi:hypothetical protein
MEIRPYRADFFFMGRVFQMQARSPGLPAALLKRPKKNTGSLVPVHQLRF